MPVRSKTSNKFENGWSMRMKFLILTMCSLATVAAPALAHAEGDTAIEASAQSLAQPRALPSAQSTVKPTVQTPVAESSDPNVQEKIPLLKVFTEIPETSWDVIQYSFMKERIPAWATILATTGVLYQYDQDIYDGVTRVGRKWNIGNGDGTKTIISGGGLNLLRVPGDLGSSLYFLGDGWTHSLIALGFFGTGYFTDNNRAYNTGVELVHGLITSTLFSQVLKRSFGREDPGQATMVRGDWRPFPSIHSYGENTAMYDAFPSGHVMTATLTFTIIEQNYPEYNCYLYPLEGVWLTALGLEMVNNGVHWASDYPLGIALGYVVGKMSTRLAHPKRDPLKTETASTWSFYPSITPDGSEMNAMYTF